MTARRPRAGWRGVSGVIDVLGVGKCGMDTLLVLLEVELGDHPVLFGRVGEADRSVGLECCAEEPAGAGSRLEAGGGAAVREDEGEALVLILVPTQVSDVNRLEAKT